MMLIQRASAFARARHAGQTRKGAAAEPYDIHLEEVAALVTGWGAPEAWIAAAWLHDTVEDCPPTSLTELEALFGAQVAGLVGELTDDKALPKPARKAAQLAHAPGRSEGAALIKIADKTSNVRALRVSAPVHWDGARKRAYMDWAAAVVAALPAGHTAARADFARELAASRAAVGDAA